MFYNLKTTHLHYEFKRNYTKTNEIFIKEEEEIK